MKGPIAFLILILASVFVFREAFSVFFVQDDFILINQFSGHNLLRDFGNSFGAPQVTHWRPVHNLYFLTWGNLFGKNYFLYHFAAFLIHAAGAFMIYKITSLIMKSENAGIIASFLYVVNPLHFVSLFWISGNATSIGFLFFTLSLLFFLKRKYLLFYFLFFSSLLTSEAMAAGSLVFAGWAIISGTKQNFVKHALLAIVLTGAFLIARQIFFPTNVVIDAYKMEFGAKTFSAAYYYVLRTIGFGEIAGDFLSSAIIMFFAAGVLALAFLKRREFYLKYPIFFCSIFLAGLFPFVFLPNHLSPHYMNISAFGISALAAYFISKSSSATGVILSILFLISSVITVAATADDNWVVKGSSISHSLISKVEAGKFEAGSTLVFGDTSFFTSEQAYVALGTGEAFRFWFKDKYHVCFEFKEKCDRGYSIY